MYRTKPLLIAVVLAVVLTATGCGGGGDSLSEDQARMATVIARDAGIQQKVAECVVKRVTDEFGDEDGLKYLAYDTNFSELYDADGIAIASAFTECNDDSFEQVFGYYPEN